MKQLHAEHYQAAMDYVLQEPEFNLFIIGDLENYGLESEQVACYTADSWDGGEFPYFLLNYRGNFIFYSCNNDYPHKEIAQFLSSTVMRNLSGKQELIEPLIPFFPGMELVPTFLSRLDAVYAAPPSSLPIRRLQADDVSAIYDLLIQIEEFFTIADKPKQTAHEDILESITHGGRMYGIFEGTHLAAIAGTSAENSMSAMIVSVATLPQFRHRGYATALVSRLCSDCLQGGMRFLCLFYDNPEAGAIYRRLGFQELGTYAMVRSI